LHVNSLKHHNVIILEQSDSLVGQLEIGMADRQTKAPVFSGEL